MIVLDATRASAQLDESVHHVDVITEEDDYGDKWRRIVIARSK